MRDQENRTFDRLRAAGRRVLPRWVLRGLKKLYYPRMLKRFDESRWPLAVVAKQLIRPGDVVVDAGANIGYVTMLLSRWVGPSGRVFSFEPVPDTAELLCHNVRALALSNVVVHACGLSDREGDAVMEIPVYEGGGGENLYESRIVTPGERHAQFRAVSVRTKTLDSIFAADAASMPSFVKMDVEGHEAQVLEGMTAIFREAKPALLVELSGPSAARARVFKHLGDLGYTAYAWTGAALQPRPEPAGDVDCFFLQVRHLDLLRTAPSGGSFFT